MKMINLLPVLPPSWLDNTAFWYSNHDVFPTLEKQQRGTQARKGEHGPGLPTLAQGPRLHILLPLSSSSLFFPPAAVSLLVPFAHLVLGGFQCSDWTAVPIGVPVTVLTRVFSVSAKQIEMLPKPMPEPVPSQFPGLQNPVNPLPRGVLH
jgi:hypothetical protein